MTKGRMVALSASFWNVPAVVALLDTCDAIYTTQAQNYVALCKLFGADRVHIIPYASPDWIEFVKAQETQHDKWYQSNTEFITYSHLYALAHPDETRKLNELREQLKNKLKGG